VVALEKQQLLLSLLQKFLRMKSNRMITSLADCAVGGMSLVRSFEDLHRESADAFDGANSIQNAAESRQKGRSWRAFWCVGVRTTTTNNNKPLFAEGAR
jgi:hypothetical protein